MVSGDLYMAFEGELGRDPSEPKDNTEYYRLSSTGLIARTIDVWIKNLIQYILIIGVASAVLIGISFVMVYYLFSVLSVVSSDPLSYILNMFLLNPTTDVGLFAVSFAFGWFMFIINAILGGAVIKFTLDSYGGFTGDISSSFRHSLSRVVTILIFQIIISLIVSVITLPALYYTNIALDLIGTIDPYNPVFPPGAVEALMTGMILLLGGTVLLFIIQAKLAPVLAVIIDTDLSAIEAIKRGWNLTGGNFLHVLAAQILLAIVVGVFTFGVSFGIGMFFGVTAIGLVVETMAIAVITSPLTFIFAAVLYRDLLARESTGDINW